MGNSAAKLQQQRTKNKLLKAAEDGSLGEVTNLVQALQNSVDEEMNECLAEACQSAAIMGHWSVVRYLVPQINDPVDRDRCCKFALKYSARWSLSLADQEFLVGTLLDQEGKNEALVEAAEYAATGNRNDTVLFLLDNLSDTKLVEACVLIINAAIRRNNWDAVIFYTTRIPDVGNQDRFYRKAVESAVDAGRDDLAESLVQRTIRTGNRDNDQWCTEAARSAAYSGRWNIVDFYIGRVTSDDNKNVCCVEIADIALHNSQWTQMELVMNLITDKDSKSACCIKAAGIAAGEGNLKFIKYLISNVSDNQYEDFSRRAVESAAIKAKSSIVEFIGIQPKWLFQSAALLNFVATRAISQNNTVLNQTLELMGSEEIVKLLLLAIQSGHVALALTLLPRVDESDIDWQDDSGTSALMLAAEFDHNELVTSLLNCGAYVNLSDHRGQTALSRACQAGHVRSARILADSGADAEHCDGEGLSCVLLAERFGHVQVVQLFAPIPMPIPMRIQPVEPGPENLDADERLSLKLHKLLKSAGFTRSRARCQQGMADLLQGIARLLCNDERQMTGSYAEGWGYNLVQMNGRTACDSDIDWTVIVNGNLFHLLGGCKELQPDCIYAEKLRIIEGHAQVQMGAGNQPAISVAASGVRPSQDTCPAFPCCSNLIAEYACQTIKSLDIPVHLVCATRPNTSSELRLSFSFHEKAIMRGLSTMQGQLFVIIKFIFKRYVTKILNAPGLKTYHAKTLLFFMLERYGQDKKTWQPKNLIKLLKVSLDMMLVFFNTTNSPDACMPHYFMSNAPIFLKNAGISDFQNTKSIVRERLGELRSDLGNLVDRIKEHVRPLRSEQFYSHPFTLLPLVPPTLVNKVNQVDSPAKQLADVYSLVNLCFTQLYSTSSGRDELMRHLSVLQQLPWCKCAALCMTAMAHLKFGEPNKADTVIRQLAGHFLQIGWSPKTRMEKDVTSRWPIWTWDSDWAWRFCLPCTTQPHLPFLPNFTQSLLTARLSQARSSHLYVNSRCLSWSLQAELLRNHPKATDRWHRELQENPDLEELLTLAHYSDYLDHVHFCLHQMETIREERRVVMETQDEDKIERVKEKLRTIQKKMDGHDD